MNAERTRTRHVDSAGFITLVAPARPHSAPTDVSSADVDEVTYTWRMKKTRMAPSHEPPTQLKMVLAPRCVSDFIRALSGVAAVKCVVAEEAENGCHHITTFANPVDDATREAIYDQELALMRDNKSLQFDFHLRHADEKSQGSPAPVASNYYFAIWGSLNARQE